MKYQTINYDLWNFEGKGKNIFSLIEPEERDIWNCAFQYQDKRNDKGHAECVTYFSLQLLKHFDGERKIVIPASILHDIGWSQMSKKEIAQFYLPNWRDFESQLRKRHQEEGVKLARKILEELNYTSKHVLEILEIISQHDTRKGFYSLEDGIARSADRLWRFTIPCINLFKKERKWSFEEMNGILNEWKNQKDFFYDDKIKKFAELELEDSINYKKINQKKI